MTIQIVNGVITDVENINGDNANHVVTCEICNNATVLDGFYVTGGLAHGTSLSDWRGAGMYTFGCDAQLLNLVIIGNMAESYGGGIYNLFSDVQLENTILSANEAVFGGGIYNYYGTPQLENVILSTNEASSGGGI